MGTAIVFMLAAFGLGVIILKIAYWVDLWTERWSDDRRGYRRRR